MHPTFAYSNRRCVRKQIQSHKVVVLICCVSFCRLKMSFIVVAILCLFGISRVAFFSLTRLAAKNNRVSSSLSSPLVSLDTVHQEVRSRRVVTRSRCGAAHQSGWQEVPRAAPAGSVQRALLRAQRAAVEVPQHARALQYPGD